MGRGFQAEQPGGPDVTISRRFDSLGEPLATARLKLDDSIDPGAVVLHQCGQGGDRHLEVGAVAHARKDSAFSATSPQKSNVVLLATDPKIGDMDDVFPSRAKLREDILAYRRTNGLSHDEMAVQLQRKPSSLKSVLYDRTRPVGTDLIQNWAALSGHRITEYIDDPGAPVAGVPQDEFGGASEQERVMLRAIAQDLSKLTPAQRRATFEAWSAIVSGFLR